MRCGILFKKTKKYWTFKAIDRNDGELLAYECGDRTIETISRLYEKLEKLKIGHFYTDNWEGFSAVLPYNKLTQTKKETHTIERHNCTSRHWAARFKRKTIAFSRSESMIKHTWNLLSNFRYGQGIQQVLNNIPLFS